MKLSDIFARIGIQVNSDKDVTGVSASSNDIQSGFVFVAVKGTRVDGADFVGDAVARGAVAVICDHMVSAEVPVIVVENPRVVLAQMANILYPSEGLKKVAITGTNGKTSTVYYVAEIMNAIGLCTASFGTIGIDSPVYKKNGSMTTPDTVSIHKELQALQQAGVQVVAMEASSHGLDQDRLAAVEFAAAGFSNLTQDHLDYHGSMAAYFTAKKRLFLERTVANGTVVLNADISEFGELKQDCAAKGLRVLSYGLAGKELKLVSRVATANGQKISVEILGRRYETEVAVVGDFQISNILCAIGLCIGLGADIEKIMHVVATLKAPAGRLECVGALPNGATVYVDYAHTPDALARVLTTLRPHAAGRLVCVFGCGGNRDAGKRPMMGEIAARLADVVYVTDDNPRHEEAAGIRAAILAACPKGIEIGNRHEAIADAVAALQAGDILVLAGKGHEAGQKIGDTVMVFDDKIEAQLAILGQTKMPVWRGEELRACLGVDVAKNMKAYGISIDTRTLEVGDLYLAMTGENVDGHDFVRVAVERGAAACVVTHLTNDVPVEKQIVVSDVMVALNQMAMFARNRSEATFIGITGSSGKTTTKEMLKIALAGQGKTHATVGNFNNQIGVPLTLCRMPIDTRYAIVEMGMNHVGELTELSQLVRPHATIITMIGAAHLAYFKDEHQIAEAKSEIFVAQDKDGTAILNADSPFYEFLRAEVVKNGIRFITAFGQNEAADFRLLSVQAIGETSRIMADWHGSKIEYTIGFLGHHFAMNSLGVLGLVDAVGASVPAAMQALSGARAVAGRGASEKVTLANGKTIVLIDDVYNANPSSMKASIGTLGLHNGPIKVAVLGDMLELGAGEVALHIGLKDALEAAGVSRVFAVGPLMKNLYESLGGTMRGSWAASADEMKTVLADSVPDGAVVLVKASNGTGLKKIISYLKEGK